ncbi:odorant receptor 67 [Nasonia vitripennis]|uniref:Odorant receptor n=1 Tax=Nasonia vitripennis TaxID=7425 RepID=A0A7M6UG93_NASVI|nr:odorant receptor 67 [Nasonia vitripennis]
MILLINKPLEYSLKLSGFWPFEFNIIGSLALISTLVTTLPFQCWQAFNFTNDFVLLMDSLSDILAEVLIFLKLFAMWKSKSCITIILREIFDEWSTEKIPDEWKTLAYYSRMFCNIDTLVYFSAAASYYPDLLMSYFGKPIENRKMLFQSCYPFNYLGSPTYELINLMQMIQAVAMMAADSLSKTLLVALILHVIANIDLLKNEIRIYSTNIANTCNHTNNKKSTVDLKQVISQHRKILYLVQSIDNAYSYVSLFQIVFSTIIICVTGFVIVTAMESANIILLFKFILYIIVMLSQAFTFCIAGQYLRNEGESIIHEIYDCLWYYTEPKEIKSLIFVLKSAQIPLTLGGGKLFELSTNSFTMIVKTSVSYLSVLRAVCV